MCAPSLQLLKHHWSIFTWKDLIISPENRRKILQKGECTCWKIVTPWIVWIWLNAIFLSFWTCPFEKNVFVLYYFSLSNIRQVYKVIFRGCSIIGGIFFYRVPSYYSEQTIQNWPNQWGILQWHISKGEWQILQCCISRKNSTCTLYWPKKDQVLFSQLFRNRYEA